jgi:hypothetical protein
MEWQIVVFSVIYMLQGSQLTAGDWRAEKIARFDAMKRAKEACAQHEAEHEKERMLRVEISKEIPPRPTATATIEQLRLPNGQVIPSRIIDFVDEQGSQPLRLLFVDWETKSGDTEVEIFLQFKKKLIGSQDRNCGSIIADKEFLLAVFRKDAFPSASVELLSKYSGTLFFKIMDLQDVKKRWRLIHEEEFEASKNGLEPSLLPINWFH